MSEMQTLAAKLRDGQFVVTAWSSLAVPIFAELLGRSGYEAVTLDMQHGMHGIESVRDGFGAAALAGSHRIARIPVGEFATASRLLDLGAEAVIAPMINSAAEAQRFADAMKYPPLGARSWGPHRTAMLSGMAPMDYRQSADRGTLALAMVETPEALNALDDILAVDGIDGVFVGPADLSLTVSKGEELDPNSETVTAHLLEVVSKCRKAGKIASTLCVTPERVHEVRDMGYQLVAYGIDLLLIREAAAQARKACNV
ncbi:HpcH/HpaI aldolase [Roseibium sp. TrichSKD4]|uniref:HpcH/HpaI aldolase family protein n=1 Tax=Roseibium sp. TrichSKD4 TaxID=744980 RepID=UPI0001E56AD9|nr:aldolase/citrate lyase family protein [Roseibium sp. TrichSKD4]EFO30682.1 HpcH/HpaI aldolase [Roseibium sp. TrichSKD4]